ncbi:MAG: inverse autotransporter beta domain-containing protein [Deltaproteobacteria bacterium]|nr:inverse autotransporter beta domain-containing protein [Deltaproteobacteria bacterium]
MAGLLLFPAGAARSADFSEGAASFGAHFSDKALYSYADFFLPLYEVPENAAFFINPNLGFDLRLKNGGRNAERGSIGLGHRLYLPGGQFGSLGGGLLDKGLILGFNWNLDGQYSPYDNFLFKTGGGVELLSDWVDMRLNGYFKLTGEKLVSRNRGSLYGTAVYASGNKLYETLLSGVDGEIGLRAPIWEQLGELRFFAGAFYHDAGHVDRVDGFKARVEWNPIPSVVIGASCYSNRDLNGEKWQLHLGFRLPFSMNELLAGGNPFSVDTTPKTGNLWKDRYTAQVRRNGL